MQSERLAGSISVNQQATEQQAITAACEPNGYFCRLFGAANLPTILLVFVGIGAIWAALRTLWAIERQTKIAEETLVFNQPPRVVVRNLCFMVIDGQPNDIQKGSLCRGEFYITNYGGSSAQIHEIRIMVWVDLEDGQLTARRPYENQVGEKPSVNLTRGASMRWEFRRFSGLGPDTATRLVFGSANLYVLGQIWYTDALGTSREVGFCRRFDRTKQRFVPIDDTDYEYSLGLLGHYPRAYFLCKATVLRLYSAFAFAVLTPPEWVCRESKP